MKVFIISVFSKISIKEHIASEYYYVSRHVSEILFPITSDQVGKWEARLFHFDLPLSADQIFSEMYDEGFVTAKIGHLLAFGERYPEEHQMYPIVALYPTVGLGRRSCDPILWSDHYNRNRIDIHWGQYEERCSNYRFLGVRLSAA